MSAFIAIMLILLGAILLALGTASDGKLALMNEFIGTCGLAAGTIITIVIKLF